MSTVKKMVPTREIEIDDCSKLPNVYSLIYILSKLHALPIKYNNNSHFYEYNGKNGTNEGNCFSNMKLMITPNFLMYILSKLYILPIKYNNNAHFYEYSEKNGTNKGN